MSRATETPRLLREWEARQGLSQTKAAKKLGVDLRQYTRWRNGETLPWRRNVERLAPKMNIPVEAFYRFEEEAGPDTRIQIARIEEQIREMHEMVTQLLQAAHSATASQMLDEEARRQARRRR